MSGQEGAPARPTVSRRSHVPSSRSESRRRSRSRDNGRRSSSTSEERHSSKGARRRDRSPSSSSKSSECDSRSKRTVEEPDSKNYPANSSKETDGRRHGDSRSRYDAYKYDKKSRYSRSVSRSRSRDRYSKKHSRRRDQSRSLDRRRPRNYSTDETSRDESEDDIDGIGLDESPPPSWSTKKNKRYSYGSDYNGQYSQYQSYQQQAPAVAPFKNDGSFLEMFKKMQESQNKEKEQAAAEQLAAGEAKKPPLSFIGKRRGGRVLKTGVVKKAKAIEEQTIEDAPKDAWSVYMQEVKKYREAKCDEEVKTRPLVK